MAVDKNMSILIVDDYKTMLRIIRNLLSQLNFPNVQEATDGASALDKLRDGSFGLVISDWNMEPMTGLQLLREVRADAKLKVLPFVMACLWAGPGAAAPSPPSDADVESTIRHHDQCG